MVRRVLTHWITTLLMKLGLYDIYVEHHPEKSWGEASVVKEDERYRIARWKHFTVHIEKL